MYKCFGGGELPIKGTIAITCKIQALREFIEEIGYVIALRSGICDIFSAAKAKKVILYPSKKKGGEIFKKKWGLKELKFCEDAIELYIDNEEEILDKILQIIEN